MLNNIFPLFPTRDLAARSQLYSWDKRGKYSPQRDLEKNLTVEKNPTLPLFLNNMNEVSVSHGCLPVFVSGFFTLAHRHRDFESRFTLSISSGRAVNSYYRAGQCE